MFTETSGRLGRSQSTVTVADLVALRPLPAVTERVNAYLAPLSTRRSAAPSSSERAPGSTSRDRTVAPLASVTASVWELAPVTSASDHATVMGSRVSLPPSVGLVSDSAGATATRTIW